MKRFLQELLIFLLLCAWSSTCFAQDKAIEILYQRLKDPVTSIENSAQIYRQLTRLYTKQHNYVAALDAAQKEANIQRRTKNKDSILWRIK